MTKRTRGSAEGVSETYTGILDWYLILTTTSIPISTETWSTFKIIVQNDPNSADDVLVGNQWSQSIRLVPGQAETIPICDPRLIYVRAVTTLARVNVHAVT